VNARPPSANIRVPSIPPWRTSATSVVPPPTSSEERTALADLLAVEDAGYGIWLGDDGDQLEVELRGHGLQRADVDQRRERVEDRQSGRCGPGIPRDS